MVRPQNLQCLFGITSGAPFGAIYNEIARSFDGILLSAILFVLQQ